MKIALIGHGKMGQYIEALALAAGDEIVLIVDESNRSGITAKDLAGADVAIEFTRPESAIPNVELALEAGVPIVVGTTGWLARLPEVTEKVAIADGSLFWASNFSIGVNVFFAVAELAAELANKYGGYGVTVEEIHHEQKLDAPSGTGITLAERVGDRLDAYDSWALARVQSAVPQTRIAPAAPPENGKKPVPITSVREPGVHGTHTLELAGPVDTLTFKHTAHSREGFAKGALTAARWLVGKQGVFTMKDLLETAN